MVFFEFLSWIVSYFSREGGDRGGRMRMYRERGGGRAAASFKPGFSLCLSYLHAVP